MVDPRSCCGFLLLVREGESPPGKRFPVWISPGVVRLRVSFFHTLQEQTGILYRPHVSPPRRPLGRRAAAERTH